MTACDSVANRSNVNIDAQVLSRKELVTFRSGAAQPPEQLAQAARQVLRSFGVAAIDLGGPTYHRVSNHTQKPLVTLHAYGVAADSLTTGINRIYAEG